MKIIIKIASNEEMEMNVTIRKMIESDRSEVVDMMRTFYHSPAVWTNGSEEIY